MEEGVVLEISNFRFKNNIIMEKKITITGGITATMTGEINHSQFKPGQKAACAISAIPTSEEAFAELYGQLATEPHGAVMSVLVAMEMYRANAAVGMECLKLIGTSANVRFTTDRLRELFASSGSYARPYQVASYFAGASPANGYNPAKPYTLSVEVNNGRPYQDSYDFQSQMLYLNVKSSGKDSADVVYVIKPAGESLFKVNNYPGLYSQCRAIAVGQTFNGL